MIQELQQGREYGSQVTLSLQGSIQGMFRLAATVEVLEVLDATISRRVKGDEPACFTTTTELPPFNPAITEEVHLFHLVGYTSL